MYVQVVTVDWQGQGSSVSTGGFLGSELSRAALLLDVVDTCKGGWMPDRLSESRIEIGLELYTVHNICIKYLSSMCPSKLVPRLRFGATNNYSAPVYNTYKGVVHVYIHRTKLRTCKKYVIIHEPLQVVTKKKRLVGNTVYSILSMLWLVIPQTARTGEHLSWSGFN